MGRAHMEGPSSVDYSESANMGLEFAIVSTPVTVYRLGTVLVQLWISFTLTPAGTSRIGALRPERWEAIRSLPRFSVLFAYKAKYFIRLSVDNCH